MTIPPIPQGRIRAAMRDGVPVMKLQCPDCGRWGDIDDDQLHGRVSVDHTDPVQDERGMVRGELCTFHETRDWSKTAQWA